MISSDPVQPALALDRPAGRHAAYRIAAGVIRLGRLVHGSLARGRRGRSLLLAALFLFVAGCLWSIRELGLDWSRLNWRAAAIALLLVGPSLWLNALELQWCGRAAGQAMPTGRALLYSNVATLSNLLPLPASVLVRGAALMNSGASLGASSRILFAAASIWLAMAGGISAFALLEGAAATAAATASLVLVIAIAAWIARHSSAATAAGFVLIRIGLLALLVARLFFCFWLIGADTAPEDVAVYTVASILGSAAGIVPAGLGVSEGIAAALATLAGALPAAAFLSVGLNRLFGLIGSALVVMWYGRPKRAGSAG